MTSLFRCFILGFILSIPFWVYAQSASTRDVGTFDAVSAGGNVKVYLSEGPAYEVRIETQDLTLDKVVTEVNKRELSIKLRMGVYKKEQLAIVYVTAPRFRSVKAGSGSWLGTSGTLRGDNIEVAAVSGGVADLELSCSLVDAKVTEGSDLFLSGQAQTLDAVAASGGHLFAFPLSCREAFVKANTGGVAEVFADELLDASSATGARIAYKGKPSKTSVSTSIGGTIEEQ